MTDIDIVLATFNGEKYLCEQIDSIIAQTYKNWRLLVSDDGSTDKTLSIIEKYAILDNRVILVNKNRQGGVVKNFSKALEFVTSKYIMFSDQDDYWLPEKIEHQKEIIEENEKIFSGKPILIFTDLVVVDANLKIINESFYLHSGLNPEFNLSKKFLLWRSTVYGCSVMFNKSLYDIAFPFSPEVTMHDQWFALMASLHGHIIYSNACHLYYRQHANNVVGGQKKNTIQRIAGVFRTLKKINNAAKLTHKTVVRINGVEEQKWKMKIKFVNKNILPFMSERPLYAFFLSCFYLIK